MRATARHSSTNRAQGFRLVPHNDVSIHCDNPAEDLVLPTFVPERCMLPSVCQDARKLVSWRPVEPLRKLSDLESTPVVASPF